MTRPDLREVLRLHALWVRGEDRGKRADLSRADLLGADLSGANLSGARSVDLIIARTRILPEGDLIGWKKCRGGVLVKLRIPADAKRSHALGRKCRAERAEVLEIIGKDEAVSLHDPNFAYRAGQTVSVEGFDEDFLNECSTGIHFYITRAEAEAHQ